MHRTLGSIAAAALLTGCSLVGIRSGYEQPAYTVVEQLDEQLEIRRYAPRLAVETVIDGSKAGDQSNTAFRRLFAYISGANEASSEVTMTVPVEAAAPTETIAMTVPVESGSSDGERDVMRFFLPSSYTLETAPRPTDPSIQVVALPDVNLAVLRFSGSWSKDNVADRRRDLLDRLNGSGWRPIGTPTTMFYDPPWTLPFFRRNEVAVTVKPRA